MVGCVEGSTLRGISLEIEKLVCVTVVVMSLTLSTNVVVVVFVFVSDTTVAVRCTVPTLLTGMLYTLYTFVGEFAVPPL